MEARGGRPGRKMAGEGETPRATLARLASGQHLVTHHSEQVSLILLEEGMVALT